MSELARAAGFRIPPTLRVSDLSVKEIGSDMRYPFIVKPTLKVTGARLIESESDVQSLPDLPDTDWLVQPFLGDQMRGLIGLMWDGRLVGATHLEYRNLWPLPVGTAASALTTVPDLALESRVTELLSEYSGLFHMDLAGDYLLDLNPRIHAGLSVAVASGVDLPVMLCRLIAGEEVARVRGVSGLLYRWLEQDVRSIMNQARSGDKSWPDAAKQLLARRGTVHSVWSLSDPVPSLVRVRKVVKAVLSAIRS
jgi:predicted ATP-grasp superfamily ATP-dependent carboligase